MLVLFEKIAIWRDKMGTYSIKDLEQISGIKAHTIRIWEQRYELLTPERTDTNIRKYGDSELVRLLNVSLLQKAGHKISKIAKLNEEEIKAAVRKISYSELKTEASIQELVIAMTDFDEGRIQAVIDNNIASLGVDETMQQIIYPFLIRIGVLWLTGYVNPAQEHFVSCLIRQKIIANTDKLPLASVDKTKVVLFLPENETHELALLYTNFLLKNRGFQTLYLGQSVPFDALVETYKSESPEVIICSITIQQPSVHLQGYIYMLGKNLKDSKVFISGRQVLEEAGKLELPENIQIIHSHQEFIQKMLLV